MSSSSSSSSSVKWIVAGVVGAAGVGYLLWKKRANAIAQKQAYPVVEQLFVHPIKGCRSFSPKTWKLTERGLEFDREWVVLKEGDPSTVITMRNCPKMARVIPTVDTDVGMLRITFDGDENGSSALAVPLVIDDARRGKNEVEFTLWGANGAAIDEGDAAAKWLSSRLGQKVRLYHASGLRDAGAVNETKRAILPKGNEVFGQDLSSIMLISQQTVAKIRKACGVPEVDAERFRANIVVDAGAADTEYTYRRMMLGTGIELTFVKHCERCVVPSVDNNGKMHPTCEPTKTLREKFSAPAEHAGPDAKAKPLAGINLYHSGTGLVWVGMQMQVLDTGAAPVFTKADK